MARRSTTPFPEASAGATGTWTGGIVEVAADDRAALMGLDPRAGGVFAHCLYRDGDRYRLRSFRVDAGLSASLRDARTDVSCFGLTDRGDLLFFGLPGVVRVFDVRTGKMSTEVALPAAAVSPDGRTLLVGCRVAWRDDFFVGSRDTRYPLYAYDLPSAKPLGTPAEVTNQITHIGFRDDGRTFVTVHQAQSTVTDAMRRNGVRNEARAWTPPARPGK